MTDNEDEKKKKIEEQGHRVTCTIVEKPNGNRTIRVNDGEKYDEDTLSEAFRLRRRFGSFPGDTVI